jgi:hypothetical protein
MSSVTTTTTDFLSLLDSGLVPENFNEIVDEDYAVGCIRDVFDRAILPFMVASRFKYRSVNDILKSTDHVQIVNDKQSVSSLLDLFLFEKINRNTSLDLDF